MSDNILIPRLAIIGVGLIGGSLSLALKDAGVVGEVVGCGRGKPNLEKALELGVIDRYTRDPVEAVKDADVIFLATPVKTLGTVTEELLPGLKPGAIMTDGGSVKGEVINMIEPLMPEGSILSLDIRLPEPKRVGQRPHFRPCIVVSVVS